MTSVQEQKIKQEDTQIGINIRRIRLETRTGQSELARKLQLMGVPMTRETLVKIERGVQHLTVTQLRGFKQALNTTYEELLNDNTLGAD